MLTHRKLGKKKQKNMLSTLIQISPLTESFSAEILHDFERYSNASQDRPLIFMTFSLEL